MNFITLAITQYDFHKIDSNKVSRPAITQYEVHNKVCNNKISVFQNRQIISNNFITNALVFKITTRYFQLKVTWGVP